MSISCCDGATSWWWYSIGIPIASRALIVSLRSSVAASIVVIAKYPPSSSVSVPASSLKRKYSSSGPMLNVSKPIDFMMNGMPAPVVQASVWLMINAIPTTNPSRGSLTCVSSVMISPSRASVKYW